MNNVTRIDDHRAAAPGQIDKAAAIALRATEICGDPQELAELVYDLLEHDDAVRRRMCDLVAILYSNSPASLVYHATHESLEQLFSAQAMAKATGEWNRKYGYVSPCAA